jgi:hypothetical protein
MAHDQGPTSHDASDVRQRRHAVRVSAFLRAGGRRRSIEITDYSVDGLSLDRAAGIELDQRVTIELRSGERLPMRVVWIKGGEAGVRFLAAIAREHTVMRSLDRAARNYKLRHPARSDQHALRHVRSVSRS